MKIAVVAANGRSGKEFVKAALAKSHYVRASVFGHHDFKDSERLKVIECDATKPEQIKNLVNGAQSIVSFIGHTKNSPPNVQTDAIQKIVDISEQHGIKRIVSLTGTGVRFPGDKITLIDRLLNLSIGLVDPARVNDGKNHVEVLKKSGTNWTVIRVLKLTNQDTKNFRLTSSGPTKVFAPRKEVALACLEVLEENSFVKQAPIISKP